MTKRNFFFWVYSSVSIKDFNWKIISSRYIICDENHRTCRASIFYHGCHFHKWTNHKFAATPFFDLKFNFMNKRVDFLTSSLFINTNSGEATVKQIFMSLVQTTHVLLPFCKKCISCQVACLFFTILWKAIGDVTTGATKTHKTNP